MIVIATGPRSNGTSLLYRIIATGGGKTPIHLPAYPPEFRDQDWATDFPTALFVVILRGERPSVRSMVARGLHADPAAAAAEQEAALEMLGELMHRIGLRCHLVLYDELVANPERTVDLIDAFLRRHGYRGAPLTLPEPVFDANAKWLVAA